MNTFYSQPIEVTVKGAVEKPIAFRWRGREYTIRDIWAEWQDAGFGPIRPGRGKWWQRRHRNYFRVVTDSDEVFEIYLDRGSGRREWYLYQKIEME